jgi:DNA-binding NarL/FixJ family response regulator
MGIRVVLADNSEAMRTAIRRTVGENPQINVVGETENFARTIQMIADLKPDVLLLDLYICENRDFTPELIKAQLNCVYMLAMSFSNDNTAKELSESYGAVALLDKMKLYGELVPAIMRCKSNERLPQADSGSYAVLDQRTGNRISFIAKSPSKANLGSTESHPPRIYARWINEDRRHSG